MNRTTLILVGVLFHAFYLWSIFDIYFVSPLVHGMAQHAATTAPPAKRLVLIVGDGLRADKTFQNITHPTTGKQDYLAPFLREKALHTGRYGVSNTRMPTESRPGHVALISGFYEDVSAVTKGWKENPVDFDLFFNQSRHTFSFGSPDILPIFAVGDVVPGRIDCHMYGHEWEDFTADSIELDRYVFDHVDLLLTNASINATLDRDLRQNGTVLFLHLLGIDTAGHGYRPYLAEYYNNIQYVDRELARLVPKLDQFFGDDGTAYVFTADHGMSDYGSHGDGHPNNTRTPLVAWGAGILGPLALDLAPALVVAAQDPVAAGYEHDYFHHWGLDHLARADLNQADIAPLMAYLIGANIPKNSVGTLPVDLLDGLDLQKARGLYNNAWALVEQYFVKEREVFEHQFLFRPYRPFEDTAVAARMDAIAAVLAEGDYWCGEQGDLARCAAVCGDAMAQARDVIQLTLDGLNYLQTYNWVFLRTIVTLGFIGWTLFLFIIFVQMFVENGSNSRENGSNSTTSSKENGGGSRENGTNYTTSSKENGGGSRENGTRKNGTGYGAVAVAVAAVLAYVLWYQNSPFNYYMYAAFPVYFWHQIACHRDSLAAGLRTMFGPMTIALRTATVVLFVGMYEAIVYGFFNRAIFSVIFVIIGVYPVVFGINSTTKAVWFATCCGMTIFTNLNPIKTDNLIQINMGVAAALAVGAAGCRGVSRRDTAVVVVQMILALIMAFSVNVAVKALLQRQGLPVVSQVTSWTILVGSLVWPVLIRTTTHSTKHLQTFLMFLPTFTVLTTSYELLFYVGFWLTLRQWVAIERAIMKASGTITPSWSQTLRITIIGFFFLQLAFFGTGNISSISSFSLDAVMRLIPVFDPFSMGALLIFKLVIPYILLSASLGVMNQQLGIRPFTISTLIISTCDVLTLNFFYLVKTEGSWLDIGTSISNYCLAMMSSLIMLGVEAFTYVGREKRE